MLPGEPDLSSDLSKLWGLQTGTYRGGPEMVRAGTGPTMLGFPSFAGLEDRIKQYVQQVREVAARHHCTGYTITVGFPWGISASFNFGFVSPQSASTQTYGPQTIIGA